MRSFLAALLTITAAILFMVGLSAVQKSWGEGIKSYLCTARRDTTAVHGKSSSNV